ncbi:MAG: PEP-CTERM sorting domain-containing protein [Opitutaceae bacterium]|nr:PEP-CTERM sorting domain-containing protein [Opitutaceae bacterium]
MGNTCQPVVPTPFPIPEPSTYAALAGLAALGFVAWRRRRVPAK